MTVAIDLLWQPERLFLVLSVSASSPDASEAAFFKINDAIKDHAEYQWLVKQGFLVRTCADADTQEARNNDTRRREQAFSSGAQLVSTDYPQPEKRFSEYYAVFPGDRTVRPNPMNSGATAEISDVRIRTATIPRH